MEILNADLILIRRLIYLVKSTKFEDLYDDCDIAMKDRFLQLLENRKFEEVIGLYKEVVLQGLDNLSVGELRKMASKLEIPFYYKYNKNDLILRIIHVRGTSSASNAEESAREDLKETTGPTPKAS